jgi:hypothetical protein
METTRRGLLALAGGIALAGCSGFGDGGDDPPESPADDQAGLEDAAPGEVRTVTVAVQPDPGSLRDAQVEIAEAIESGELTQQEAREQLARRERELLADATADAEELLADTDLTIRESIPEQGVLLVEGTAGGLLDFLSAPMVNALLGEQQFERARQRENSISSGLPDGNRTENESGT